MCAKLDRDGDSRVEADRAGRGIRQRVSSRWLAVVLVASSRRKGGVGAGDGEKERRKRTNLLVQRSVLSPTGVARAVFPFRRRPQAEPSSLGSAWDAG